MGIVSIAGIVEDVLVTIGSLTVPADFHVIRATRHSKGGTPQVLLGKPTLKTAGFKLDYITDTFSFKVRNVEEVYHPKRPPALKKKLAHQVQLSKEDKVEEKKSKEAKEKLKKGKGLRNSPPHVKKKKKDPMKKKLSPTKRNNKKNEKKKEKEKNWALARPDPPGGVAARSENAKFLIPGATARPLPSNGAPAHLVRPREGLGAPAR
ncbi:hypothetical protein PIB30_043433 [Stylosanthes scabra]|uniref:Uncharacterized protein n=1 Tax=Stylosanthes scabra TaxID=79078 RepID=A0ABU6UI82_9FABA|nr:hypothetical protein [Stylosanthes scabra]